MADDSRFRYKENASKVLKQERVRNSKNEPTGESDRVTAADLQMGAAIRGRPRPPVKTKRKKEDDIIASTAAKKAARDAYEELLKAGGTYAPTTKATERVWETFLTQITAALPTVSRDVLTSAAEEALNILKDAERTARDKRRDVEGLLGKLSDEGYRLMVERAEQLTDFVVQVGTNEGLESRRRNKESEIAIVFEKESDEEEGDLPGAEALDEEDVVEDEEVSGESSEEEEDRDEAVVRRARGDVEMADDVEKDHLLDPHSIDAYWLQREIALTTTDSDEAHRLAELVLSTLGERDASAREYLLVSNLGYERTDLVKKLMRNRAVIYYCTRLARAKDEKEREAIRAEMLEDPSAQGEAILRSLAGISSVGETKKSVASSKAGTTMKETSQTEASAAAGKKRILPSARVIDLKSLSKINPRQRTNQVVLPKGSWNKTTKQWEEVHVRPHKSRPLGENEEIVQIASLPSWMQPAFANMTSLNRVQSKVFRPIMDVERFNMLVSAPTGAGKTNVAMLAVMNEIGQFVVDGKVDTEAMKERLKIVYVAPMKALVQEVVANFSSRLTKQYGITVKELSGDQQLSRAEIASTQMIVTTPEKWDVVTRKAGERSFVSMVKLIIIDEIHLLHDSRGAVLEAVVARTLRSNEESKAPCRILGISATLPNYEDVALFLRVPLDKGLFYFDSSFRPVPLQQVFIGVTDKKAINRMKTMDQACYEKVSFAAKSNQVLVFVHSRKDTVKTAKMMRDKSVEDDTQQNFLPPGIHSREILTRCATNALTGNEDEDNQIARSPDLRDLLPYGFAVHHAGMHKSDRKLVEDLFAGGHVRVLVSTATLAWGINLPAHTVVIKGTQVYNPEVSDWTELGHLDLLQMLGRAGRPQFDMDEGAEGIVITSLHEMQHYLSLLNDQLPVESTLMKRLPDHLNAEIVCGNVSDISDAVTWLGYSFLLVRALKHPERYGVPSDYEPDDEDLVQWRADLAHAAMLALDKQQMIRYDRKTGMCQSTAMGRIASHYYLSPETCGAFNKLLEPNTTDIDLFRVITAADEFKQVQVRYEEKLELAKLVERVPIPIRESLEDPSAKINVLLQAYISRAPLEGYCLACDMVYVHQSAARLARALFEICLQKNWAAVSRRCLKLCISVDRRLWCSQIPLRQFHSSVLNEDVFRQLEKRAMRFSQYRELSAVELGAKLQPPTLGVPLHKAIHRLPKLDVAARVQTLTRSVLKLELSLTADFEYYEPFHGPGLLFWILVEDVDGSELLHYEPFLLKARYTQDEHLVQFCIQINEPTPPFVFVRIEADAFLHASSSLAVPLGLLTLPNKSPPFSELLDMSPIQVSAMPTYQKTYMERVHPDIKQLWPSQTQAYSLIESDDASILVCCPIGKNLVAELTMIKSLEKDSDARIVLLLPGKDQHAMETKLAFFQNALSRSKVVMLSGVDQNADLAALTECNLAISTSKTWEVLTRRWKQKSRKVTTELSLLVCDDLHGMDDAMEICLSRTRYMCAQLDRHIRILGLSTSLTDAEDVAGWMDAKKLLNLSPAARPFATEIVVRGFSDFIFDSRIGAMARPCYRSIKRNDATIVFLPSKRHLRLLLIDLVNFASAEQVPFKTEGLGSDELADLANEARSSLESGVGILHESMSKKDFAQTESIFSKGKCKLLLVSAKAVMRMNDSTRSNNVILIGTSWFFNKRYEEYPFSLILKMLNKACSPPINQQIVFCYEPVKNYYKRFLVAGQNLESTLDQAAPDVLLAEIVSKTIETKQDAIDFFTWTLFYRRLVRNPSYYGMLKRGASSIETALSTFLSDTVERVLEELRESKCLEPERDEQDEGADRILPSPLGMITAFHDVRSSTVDLFASSLQAKTRISGLLEILSSASEYLESGSVRAKEEPVLERLARNSECVIYKLPGSVTNELSYSDSYVKCNILLQAWCSRFPLGVDQREDLVAILRDAPKLLHALVDVSAMHSWLKVTLTIVELCQSIVQQVWARDSPLRQVPYFDTILRPRFEEAKLQSVYDLIEMDDDKREKLLSVLSQTQLARVAEFCNAYPSLDVGLRASVGGKEVPDAKSVRNVPSGSEFTLHVLFNRDEEAEGEEEETKVVSDKFPHEKTNVWWAILGDQASNELLAIKRVANHQAKLSYVFEQPATRNLKLYIVSDSYVGSDQVFDVVVDVV